MRGGLFAGIALALVVPLWADEPQRADRQTFHVPYRLSESNHVVIRAKLNGKGPFNFAVDTGAPFLFVSTAVGKQAGVEPGKDAWGTIDRFEIEGGIVIEKAKARIDSLARLDAANALGIIGMPIHGLLGYDILAGYRLELDLTRPKMTWTRLDFKPPPAEGVGPKGDPAQLDALANAMKLLGSLLGSKPGEPQPRGFLGIELAEGDGAVLVKAVLPQSPAAVAGVQAKDRITHFRGEKVTNRADLLRLAEKLTIGDTAGVTVRRGEVTHQLAVKLGKGL
jgi:hypothetical protein